MKTLALFFVAATWPSLAADYQKCADFLNVSDQELADRSHDTIDNRRYSYWLAPGITARLRYFPLELKENGDVVCNPHGVSGVACEQEQRDAALVHTIRFPIPRLQSLEVNSSRSILSRPDKPSKATITITQRDDGMELLEELNLTHEERSFGLELASYLDGGDTVQGFLQEGARIQFEVKNGECTPKEASLFFAHPSDQARKVEVVLFSLPACRELKEFMDAHPELDAIFSDNHNDGIVDVLKNYFGRFFRPREGFERTMDANELKDAVLTIRRSNDTIPPDVSVFHAIYANANDGVGEMRARGFSPVLAGHTLLQGCYDQGLEPFLE